MILCYGIKQQWHSFSEVAVLQIQPTSTLLDDNLSRAHQTKLSYTAETQASRTRPLDWLHELSNRVVNIFPHTRMAKEEESVPSPKPLKTSQLNLGSGFLQRIFLFTNILSNCSTRSYKLRARAVVILKEFFINKN